MTPDDITFIRQCLPETLSFPYFADRESAWLMRRALPEATPVRSLRSGPFGKLLNRDVIKPVVAASGGALKACDFEGLADADFMSGTHTSAALAGVEAALGGPWSDFTLTLTEWGTKASDWHWNQLSRKGGNLVVQLGFPSQHARLMGKYLGRNIRKDIEYYDHPVRQTGCPTLAWARLDVDLSTGEMLIEEVQSDWLRFVIDQMSHMRRTAPRSRALKQMQLYERHLRQTYARMWPKAMLLAALDVGVTHLGCTRIFMHTPHSGALLKDITSTLPPRSLYTDLPKSFCFEPTADAPSFLIRPRRRALSLLANKEAAPFWRLSL